jgi:uncharacterized protein YhhL (DUF1145 family)
MECISFGRPITLGYFFFSLNNLFLPFLVSYQLLTFCTSSFFLMFHIQSVNWVVDY